ncbi:hypothetical protein J4456_02110 [Candidatus Pacearchaeota archaeon]|nr:hypothetical protein [Candidatus Pacearchaeota archaeon]
MYNTTYLPTIEKFYIDLFRSLDSKNLPHSKNHYPQSKLKVMKCIEDTNGEWVPSQDSLEKKVL